MADLKGVAGAITVQAAKDRTDEVRVVAAVIRRGQHLLVCQRPQHKRHGGLWEFPGGKVEPGETDLAALRRELREELDLELVHCGTALFEHRDEGSCFRIVFIPVEVEGEMTPLEHDGAEWMTPEDLGEMALAPTDRHFVQYLREELSLTG